MAMRLPTKQLPAFLLLCWAAMLVLSVSEFVWKTSDNLRVATLVVTFSGFLFHLALMFRKDRVQ
jgi:hypothetical protein